MTRHRFDTFSFLAGAIAVTVGVLVLADVFTLRVVDLRVVGPVLVLALGLALLVGGGRDTAADRELDEPTEPTDPDDPDGIAGAGVDEPAAPERSAETTEITDGPDPSRPES